MDALRKMTIMPARDSKASPALRSKGRLQSARMRYRRLRPRGWRDRATWRGPINSRRALNTSWSRKVVKDPAGSAQRRPARRCASSAIGPLLHPETPAGRSSQRDRAAPGSILLPGGEVSMSVPGLDRVRERGERPVWAHGMNTTDPHSSDIGGYSSEAFDSDHADRSQRWSRPSCRARTQASDHDDGETGSRPHLNLTDLYVFERRSESSDGVPRGTSCRDEHQSRRARQQYYFSTQEVRIQVPEGTTIKRRVQGRDLRFTFGARIPDTAARERVVRRGRPEIRRRRPTRARS